MERPEIIGSMHHVTHELWTLRLPTSGPQNSRIEAEPCPYIGRSLRVTLDHLAASGRQDTCPDSFTAHVLGSGKDIQ